MASVKDNRVEAPEIVSDIMQIGLKVFPEDIDNDYPGVFDYFEVYVPPGIDPSLFEDRAVSLAV
jgi:hypothetical protein